ncbi:MAG TPA: hypothetical protein VGQ82_09855, partial [Chthoniobacterales bacterium]|nr:hypothetical protein [Chthoniobacterales bacterium]
GVESWPVAGMGRSDELAHVAAGAALLWAEELSLVVVRERRGIGEFVPHRFPQNAEWPVLAVLPAERTTRV